MSESERDILLYNILWGLGVILNHIECKGKIPPPNLTANTSKWLDNISEILDRAESPK